jgi:glycosyltransferase involved in cell wall biosynthesis
MSPSASRPKVALVVHDFDPTLGQGRYCHELVRRLHSDLTFEVHAHTWTDPGVSGVVWRRIPAWRFNVITTIASYLPGAEWSLRRHPAEVIHAQGLSSWRADIITGHMCNGARRRHLRGASWRSRYFAQWVTPVERAFYRQPRARHLIAIARALGREIQSEYGWNKAMHVIYHGTDCERFRPAHDRAERRSLQHRFGVPEDRWLWLFMGEAVKGLGAAIQQLPEFPQAHLLVVSRSVMDLYREQAQRLGVMNRITFHGFDPKPEEAFRAVDVFLYPNDYDPFGLVVTEAMASGLPVVVGRDIGAAELVAHEQDGLVCDPKDAASVAACLRLLTSRAGLGAQLGAAARRKAEHYSWDLCARQTLRVYEAALRDRAAA